MRARLPFLWVLVAVMTFTGSARAHQTESQRSVVVQLEDDEALLLISWTAPSGLLGSLMVARSSLSKAPKATLERLMARRALTDLKIEIDGHPVALTGVESKLTLDTSSLHRHTVTLLARISLPAHGTLAVQARGHEVTRLAWSNRRRHTGLRPNRKPGTWNRAPVRLHF